MNNPNFKWSSVTGSAHFWPKFIVFILHLVGLIGLSMDVSRPYFQGMTPFHLLALVAILLFYHKDWRIDFWVFMTIAFGFGMAAEIIGVKTGLIFGDYHYGTALGPKYMEVPLMIGVNWFLLVYLTGGIFFTMIYNDFLAALAGALLMVFIDLNLEPVAVKLDFWTWGTSEIPLSNYIGWFAIAFIIQLFYRKLNFKKLNPLNPFILINLIVFFAILAFIL